MQAETLAALVEAVLLTTRGPVTVQALAEAAGDETVAVQDVYHSIQRLR